MKRLLVAIAFLLLTASAASAQDSNQCAGFGCAGSASSGVPPLADAATTAVSADAIKGYATASLPACAAGKLNFVAYDSTLGQLVVCNGTAYVPKVGTTVLYSTAVAVTTTGTSIETVGSYALPAAFLGTDGKSISFEIAISCVDTDSKTLTINFGAKTLAAIPYTVCGTDGGSWHRGVIFRRSGTVQVAVVEQGTSNNGGGARVTFPAETLANSITLTVRLTTPTTAGDATLEAFRVVSDR